jgi:phosphoglycerate kinase
LPHSKINTIDTLFEKYPAILLDNIRQDKREEKNDAGFAKMLSSGFDMYISDAFAVCHREQASVSAITQFLPSYGGFLLKREIENLSQALNAPTEGKTIILGGAKISTKLPVIKNFISKAEHIIVGGAIANNFFRTQGIDIGASVADQTETDISSYKIILPHDFLITDDKSGRSGARAMQLGDIKSYQLIIDAGPESVEKFVEIVRNSSMVVWNGPIGLCEIEAFASGTQIIAQAVAETNFSIIGGGDTIAAVDKLGLLNKYSFVSTGGGAMLAFLAGERLPGLVALGYNS